MTLSWTCDKLGVMARGVEDTMLVLEAIKGPDEKDVACIPAGLSFDAGKSVAGLKVGYFPEWMKVGSGYGCGSGGAGDGEEVGDGVGGGVAAGLALRLAEHYFVCGECGGV
jgi:hypothetical protein